MLMLSNVSFSFIAMLLLSNYLFVILFCFARHAPHRHRAGRRGARGRALRHGGDIVSYDMLLQCIITL